jgi:hypothetical protein
MPRVTGMAAETATRNSNRRNMLLRRSGLLRRGNREGFPARGLNRERPPHSDNHEDSGPATPARHRRTRCRRRRPRGSPGEGDIGEGLPHARGISGWVIPRESYSMLLGSPPATVSLAQGLNQ